MPGGHLMRVEPTRGVGIADSVGECGRRRWTLSRSCARRVPSRSSAHRPTRREPATKCGATCNPSSDYELYLVNPTISEVDGTPVYPSLADLPVVPDLVDVFRRHEQLPAVLEDTIEVGAKTLWLQLGSVARTGGP